MAGSGSASCPSSPSRCHSWAGEPPRPLCLPLHPRACRCSSSSSPSSSSSSSRRDRRPPSPPQVKRSRHCDSRTCTPPASCQQSAFPAPTRQHSRPARVSTHAPRHLRHRMDVQAPLGSTPSAFSGKTRLRPPPPLRRLFGPPESGRGTRAVFELPSVHDSTCFGVRRGLEWARGELRDAPGCARAGVRGFKS